ncbi:MucR family transcriptional regulator [Sphingomonas sp. 1P08PE]|uniref:MucR family transcriptional regulator n=1 Tax=Sphingomonas sp. 1P08PE TaxID=554122 RepID=UPI0039A088D9
MNDPTNPVELATELTAAWLANPNTRVEVDAVPSLLAAIHAAIVQLDSGARSIEADARQHTVDEHVPAVTVRKSLASPDQIISMIDGKPYRTLRRHLSTNGLTPDDYRARYKLKADYPMVAPTYSEARRAMAKKIGLGRKKTEPTEQSAAPAKPRRRKLGVSVKS